MPLMLARVRRVGNTERCRTRLILWRLTQVASRSDCGRGFRKIEMSASAVEHYW